MNVLVLNYSQSGQLDQILDNLLEPLSDWNVERHKVKMKVPFDFPWNATRFYDAMPESVEEDPAEIENIQFEKEQYDLVIFGYQPWFLSPSIPATSILKNSEVAKRMNGAKVITVIGARNMWLNAHDAVTTMVKENGGKMIGNIPLIDRSPNLASAVAIVHWMMTGKKTKKWGIFPKPGISDQDIEESKDFGKIIKEEITGNDLQKKIMETGKIGISTNILFIEGRAKKLFRIWAGIVKRKGTTPNKRRRWLVVFRCYLNFALFAISPIVLTIYTLLVRPFTGASIKKKKEHYYYLGID